MISSTDELPEIYALRHGVRSSIIKIISSNLSSFQPHLIEHRLVSSDTATNIMSRTGTTNQDKAGEFIRSIEVTLEESGHPQELFEEFVEILAREGEEDLVEKIVKNYGKGDITCSQKLLACNLI